MLISPPFLPPRGDLTEEQWLAAAMNAGAPGAGAYPVSANLEWHGGVHLTAPLNGITPEPIRAIADGTVVFVREPTLTNDPTSPLYYGGGYTSDGVVVIQHDTEIGANAQNQTTAVRFYSVYQHLYNVRSTVRINRPIWRKDEIGQAGHIYGTPNQIHFEIRLDHSNLSSLIGRGSGDLPTDRNGRSDAIYGEIYFYLPTGTPIYDQQPLPNSPTAQVAAAKKAGKSAPLTELTPAAHTGEAMIIGIRYAGGTGLAGQRGHAFITSYRLDGTTYGTALIEPDAEYNLYRTCNTISKSYPATRRPAPSAVMELLRFGRIIGSDPLIPADTPHWREVSHADGKGWINLNASGIQKFSDADFPHWKGWKLIADDPNNDARCDSLTITSWLDRSGARTEIHSERVAALAQDSIAARMRKTICRIPCEWDSNAFDSRWSWLVGSTKGDGTQLTEADYKIFRQHIESLCFNYSPLFNAIYTLHPIQFILELRKCGWMKLEEAIQTIPQTTKKLTSFSFIKHENGSNELMTTRLRRWLPALNKMLRKYGMDLPQRRVHFLANVWEETDHLRLMVETQGNNRPYAPWWGRGLIQLTGLENYKKYGIYRGFTISINSGLYAPLGWDPDEMIANNDPNCIDTGVYWINPSAAATGRNILIDADISANIIQFIQTARGTNDDVAIENINGLEARLQKAVYLKYILLDSPRPANTEQLTFNWRRSSEKTGARILPNGSEKRFFELTQHTIDVDITPRRPQ